MSFCPFCDFEKEIKYRLLEETENFYLIPTVGAFVEGYLLIISKKHFDNISCLPPEILSELGRLEEKATRFLKQAYKNPVIAFEHGDCVLSRQKAGACVIHLHLALVATSKGVEQKIINDIGPSTVIASFTDLLPLCYSMTAYLLLRNQQGELMYWKVKNIISQYIRRLLTDSSDDTFDWKQNQYEENIDKIIAKWKVWKNQETLTV